MKRGLWIIFAILSILIGLYPAIYYFHDNRFGLLSSKSEALTSSTPYLVFFYAHITFGGLALLIGWTQFITAFKNKQLPRHKTIGKVYVGAALISALASFYIAEFANGGLISTLGFSSLGLIWISTTCMAYSAIRNRHIVVHQKMMIYSYAACFAAVTLRIWLPLLISLIGDYFISYKIVSWLCWVPNMIVAYFIAQRVDEKKAASIFL